MSPNPSWAIEDDGSSRVLCIGSRQFRTNYSRQIIELLITRKGPERASQFLVHHDARCWFLKPLFEYYRVLRKGGVVGFWDTPNRYYPFESHSVGLPLISLLPPQIAYAYARLFKHSKMKDVNFPLFVRAGTGWRNSSYYELLPKSLMIDVADVSEEFGYQSGCGRFAKLMARILRVPPSFFSPRLNVVFRKLRQYE
jgi:hypothetical protein